jgi:hypothetical protein
MMKQLGIAVVGLLFIGVSTASFAQQPQRPAKPTVSKPAAKPPGTRGIAVEGKPDAAPAAAPAEPPEGEDVAAQPPAPPPPAAKPGAAAAKPAAPPPPAAAKGASADRRQTNPETKACGQGRPAAPSALVSATVRIWRRLLLSWSARGRRPAMC